MFNVRVDIVRLVHPDPVLVVVIRRVVVDGNPAGVREVDPVQGVVVGTGVQVTLLWSEFSRRIPFSPLLHTVLFTSSFQLDPLTSIPFHPLLQTLFWVTLFPITALSKQDPVLVVPPGCVVEHRVVPKSWRGRYAVLRVVVRNVVDKGRCSSSSS